ncbi:MAG: DUF2905 domain-containing protein [Comamonas sp.]|nr:DUF2905 domain-containing protein [Comamonas sp.]
MIRWLALVFIALVLLDSATGILDKLWRKLPGGRLPGDFQWRLLRWQIRLPIASAVLLTVLLFSALKLLAAGGEGG